MNIANVLYLLALFSVLNTTPVVAQWDSQSRRAKQAFDRAGTHLKNREYKLAIESLEKAVAIDTGFAGAYQQLGDILRRQQDYAAAARNYEKVIQLDSALTTLTWFGLGESLLRIGNYRDALTALKRYRGTPGLDPEGKRLTDKYILDCEFSVTAVANPVPFLPQNQGPAIN